MWCSRHAPELPCFDRWILARYPVQWPTLCILGRIRGPNTRVALHPALKPTTQDMTSYVGGVSSSPAYIVVGLNGQLGQAQDGHMSVFDGVIIRLRGDMGGSDCTSPITLAVATVRHRLWQASDPTR